MASAVHVAMSGNPDIDGMLIGVKWSTTSLTFSFPTSGSFYGATYEQGTGQPTDGFAQLNAAQQATVYAVLADYAAVSNLTFTQITETATTHATLREAQSAMPFTADTYYPGTNYTAPGSSDSFYGTSHNWYQNPVIGTYGFYTFMHEIGIALGLQDDVTGNDLPSNLDDMASTVESYRSYLGASTAGLHNEDGSYVETPMIYDIATVQEMYGENDSGIGATKVYTWSPTTGQEFVNGVGQGVPAENRIFEAVWTQGAKATYDLSNYSTNLNVNLNPGAWSAFSSAQLAQTGDDSSGTDWAPGNVGNALISPNGYGAITGFDGGSGSNTIVENNYGDTIVSGTGGGNVVYEGSGNDTIDGGPGAGNELVFTAAHTAYTFTDNGGPVTVTGPDGTDVIKDFSDLHFEDGDFTLAQLGDTGHSDPVIAPTSP